MRKSSLLAFVAVAGFAFGLMIGKGRKPYPVPVPQPVRPSVMTIRGPFDEPPLVIRLYAVRENAVMNKYAEPIVGTSYAVWLDETTILYGHRVTGSP